MQGMPMRTTLIPATTLLILPLLVAAASAAPNDSEATRRFSRDDNGCANLAGAMVSKTENQWSKDKLAEWKRACEDHPFRDMCEETNREIRNARGISLLHCQTQY